MAQGVVFLRQWRSVLLLLRLVVVIVLACPKKVCADEEVTDFPVVVLRNRSAAAAATATAAQPLVDDEDVVPAPMYALLQPDSTTGDQGDSNSTGKLGLVATVGGSTPATAHAVSAIIYEELAHRVQRLLLQQSRQHGEHGFDERLATTVAHLRSAMTRLSLLFQQQRQQQQQPQQPLNEGAPIEGALQREQRKASPVFDEQPQQQGQRGQVAVVEEEERSWQHQQQLTQVFLRKYLADSASLTDLEASGVLSREGSEGATVSRTASKRHFSGVRAARMHAAPSSGSSSGRPGLRVRRDVETALSQALLSARFSVTRWQNQANLVSRSDPDEDISKRGYVLADSCVAIDFRDAIRSAAAPSVPENEAHGGELGFVTSRNAAAASAADALMEASTLRRFDENSDSCVCPAGWTPCTKEEALRVSYGWRQTLGRACAEERQQQQQQEGLQLRAYTKGLHSFGCDGSQLSSREAKDGEAECASAAFILCKELSPRCGVSQWSEWSSCSAPCGEGQAYRWRRPLLERGGDKGDEKDTSFSVELPRSCAPYHLEERRHCKAQTECPSFVRPEPCFWAYAKADESQSVYSSGSCLCSEGVGGHSGGTTSLLSIPGTGDQPLIACSAEEAAYSFSQWRKAMLRFCFGALNLDGKPYKMIKYSRMAGRTRVGLGALGFVDCSGGWGAFSSPSAMRTFCGEGRPMLCRRSTSSGATVPFAVDGFADLHISALQRSSAPPHELDDAESLDASWLFFLTGASVAALLLLFVFVQRSRLLIFIKNRARPAAAAVVAAASTAISSSRRKAWRNE
ncbi:hypothetical protein Esti_003093 [Eimeria stiedai]